MTRKEVQDKIREICVNNTKDGIKNSIHEWLISNKCSEFEINQILNDLTSYQEYLEA